MTCDEARRTGNLEHIGSCPACRALFEPRATFHDLRSQLAAEAPGGCDVDALIDAAYGEPFDFAQGKPPVEAHLASCAACRKMLDDYRVLVARLDGMAAEPSAPFPAECAALDEAISLAAIGEGEPPDHCPACRARFEQRRDAVRALDILPREPGVTFAQIRFARPRVSPRWAAAAALLLALFFFLPRPAAPPPVVAGKTYMSVPSVKRLADALESPDEATALQAVETLRAVGGPVAEQYLIDALGRRPSLDPAIAGALAAMGSTAAVPKLVAGARGAAASFLPALAELGDPHAIRALIEALDEPALASIAARALARMDEIHLRPELELFAVGATAEEAAALARTPNRVVRETALNIAALDPDRRAAVLGAADLDLLVLAAGESALEQAAFARLRRQPREAVVAAIERALEDDLIAAAGARAAAGVGAVELVDSLIAALRRRPIERRKIRESLVELGDPRGVRELLADPDAIEELAQAPPELVRRAAGTVLGDPRVVRTLAKLPDDYAALLIEALQRRTSRVEAIRALTELRHAPAVPYLIPLLDSRDADEAHHALVMITGAALRARRTDWIRWWMNRRI